MGDGWDHVWAGVQAVGSIVGIFAAVWVGYAAIRAENKRNMARGRVVAFRLSPDMMTILAEVRRGLGALEALRANMDSPGMVNRTTMENVWALRVTHVIQRDVFSESWTLPPAVALSLAQLDNILGVHMRTLENAESAMISMSNEQKLKFLGTVKVNLDAIGELAGEVQAHCGAVSDAIAKTVRAK